MSASLNNATTADDYTRANEVAQAGTVRVNFQVYNAAIYWQFARDSRGVESGFQPETFLGPGFYSFDRAAEAVQIRSAVAGVPAQVTIELLTRGDLGD